nr:hypothetical protein [Tanacetum cinerariifolium]
MTIDQQVALDEALVPHASRLRIGESNFHLRSYITSKESTLQVVYDVLRLTPFYKAFLVTADVPEIYMQEFWATATVHHHSIRFKMNKKKCIVNLEYFREMLHICPRIPNQTFDELLFEEKILAFLRYLVNSGEIKKITDVNINKLHQPWRSFATVINKCLSGKSTSYDSLRLSQAQILWGMYHKKNVDFAYLRWEDFVYQVEHKYAKKSNEMYYPGSSTSQDKASVRKTQSSSDTTMPPPTAVGTRLSTSAKGKQPAKSSKAKGLYVLSEKSSDEDDDDDVDDQSDAADDDDDDDDQEDEDEQDDDDQDDNDDDQDSDYDSDDFVHPRLSTHDEEAKDEESFYPIVQTSSHVDNSDDERNDDVSHGMNVVGDEGLDVEDDDEEFYRDVNINLEGRDIQMTDVHTTQVLEDTHVTLTPVNLDGQQQSSSVSSQFFTSMFNQVLMQMESNKSIYRFDEQQNLYTALVDAYEYRGSKKRRACKEPESISALKEKASKTSGKSTEGSKSHQKTTSAPALAEEPMHTTLDEPSHQEFETGAADDQPVAEASQHPEWFQKQTKPPTPDRDWNKTLPATQGSIQPWISDMAKQVESHASFNELMDTPVDFSAFMMNRLKEDTMTPKLLPGPTYELMKGSYKSLGHKHQQFYGFLVNRESARDVYSKRRIIAVIELQIVKWHNYKHLDWITVRRDDDKLYKLKEGDLKRLRFQDIKEVFLLLVHGKLTNLTVEERFAFNVSLRMFTRSIVIQRRVKDLQLGVKSYQKKLNLTKLDTYRSYLKCKEASPANSNPRGFIYQNKDKQNRLMRIDELHKFSDGTLNDVRTTLDDHLKGRDDDKLYKFKEGDLKRLRIQNIEDMLLSSGSRKADQSHYTYRSDLKRKEAYTAYSNPRGFIYQNKDKQNRLIRIDELHKFSDDTLNDVRTALDDRLKGIWMKYLPQTIWRRSDKEIAAAMIQDIDKQLKTRRIMRSLEKFVGGTLYEGDFRMLQRTI